MKIASIGGILTERWLHRCKREGGSSLMWQRGYLDVTALYTRRAVAMSSTAMPTDLKTVVAER